MLSSVTNECWLIMFSIGKSPYWCPWWGLTSWVLAVQMRQACWCSVVLRILAQVLCGGILFIGTGSPWPGMLCFWYAFPHISVFSGFSRFLCSKASGPFANYMLARRGVGLAIGGTGWCLVGSRGLPMPNIYVTKDNRAGSHFTFIPVIIFTHITFSEVLLKVWALKPKG